MAATDTGRAIRAAVYRHVFVLKDTSGNPVSAATSLDSEYSLDSASFSDCTNEATEISGGVYYLDLTAAEMTGDTVTLKVSSAEAVTYVELIPTEPCLDAGTAQSGATSSITLASTASTSDDLYNHGTIELLRGTGAGQVRTVTDYTGSSRVAAVDRDWITNPDSSTVYVVRGETGSPASVAGYIDANVLAINSATAPAVALGVVYAGVVDVGTVSDAAPTTSDFDGDSSLNSSDDFYNNMNICFMDGNLKHYTERINDYTGSSRNIALATALPQAPANGDQFIIVAKVF
jgi:hypothetical protein